MHKHLHILLSVALCLALLAGLCPAQRAQALSFAEKYPDQHFRETFEPDRPMTVEELMVMTTCRAQYLDGVSGTAPADKTGHRPSPWAEPYVLALYQKNRFDPALVDYHAPATLGFYMEFLARSKYLNPFDAANLYTFTGTEDYTAEQKLLLCQAVDYGFVPYTQGMDVTQANLLRRDAYTKYLIPSGEVQPVRGIAHRTTTYPWSMTSFEDTWNYYDETKDDAGRAQLETLRRNKDNFNLVNLNVFLLRRDGTDGSFVDNSAVYAQDPVAGKQVHRELIDFCHSEDIKILCGVYNYFSPVTLQAMQADPSAVGRVADELVGYVDKYGFDGIDLDIEMFENTYRAQYSALLQALDVRLHDASRQKLLVATAGAYLKTADMEKGFYDYNVLRDTCDLVSVILYDEHSARGYNAAASSGAGAAALEQRIGVVSTWQYVRRCAVYAAVMLGEDKAMVSVSSYGVDFDTTASHATIISHGRIRDLLNTYNPEISTGGELVDGAWFAYTEDGHSHRVYYESEQGLKNRLDLATRFGMAGVNVFCAQYDQPEIFNLMGAKLMDLPFRDVERGFYYEPLRWALANGITTGTSPNTFSPNGTCTRGQVVTFLWRTAGSPEPNSAENPFIDVAPGAFYYKAVLWAVENGITNGLSADSFGPAANCTRGQVVTFLYRFAGKPEVKAQTNPFADVGDTAFYYTPVLWAVENGVTNGITAVSFGPANMCTRAQVVTFLYRCAGKESKT